MPEKQTLDKAQRDLRQGKSPSTAAGEFVQEEIEHVREGKHGARSAKQAIAIGLSKARRAGIPLPAPKRGKTSQSTRRSAQRDLAKGAKGQGKAKPPSPKRSRAALQALRAESKQTASSAALSQQAKSAAARRRRSTRTAKPRRARAA